MGLKSIAAIAILLFLAAPGSSQIQQQADAMAKAEAFAQAKQWSDVVRTYEALLKDDPNLGPVWNRLGWARLELGTYPEAIAAFEHALAMGNNQRPKPLVMYGLGSAYALNGDKDQAFEWIGKAIDAHLQLPDQITHDSNLANLLNDPRFPPLVEKAKRAALICRNTPEYRQFDFMLGNWSVTSSGIQDFSADNIIKADVDDCVVESVWTARVGHYIAKTFSFYDPVAQKWHQSSVDSSAVSMTLEGEYRDGAMRFLGEMYTPMGKRLARITFFNGGPNQVRHLVETSSDGKLWSISFDATYERKK